jgi:hypothetical protein
VAGAVLSQRLLRWPLAAVLLLIINAVAALVVATRIHFDNAPELYLPKNTASVQLDDRLRREFPNHEVLIGLLTGSNL